MVQEQRAEVLVRDMAEGDLDWVTALVARNHRDALTPEERLTRGFVQGVHNPTTLRQRMGPDTPGCLVAEVGGERAGVLLSATRENSPGMAAGELVRLAPGMLDGHSFFLYGFALVAEDFRGHGVMRALKDELLRRNVGRFDVAVAYVEAENPTSLAVHEKLGFRPIGTFRYDDREYVAIAQEAGAAL